MAPSGRERSGCPIHAAVEVIGDSWTPILLRDIMFGDFRFFREIHRNSLEGIAPNILSRRLKSLIDAGLLTRDDAGPGQRARYSLTEAGIQTLPILIALGNWGLAHRDGSPELRARAEALRDGGPELTLDFMDELRERHLGTPKTTTGRPPASQVLQAACVRASDASR